MSIERICRDQRTAAVDRTEYREAGQAATNRAGFELILQNAGGKSAVEPLSSEQVAAQAELLRLQMMSDAISLGSDQAPLRDFFSRNGGVAQLVQGLAAYRGNGASGQSGEAAATESAPVNGRGGESGMTAYSGDSRTGAGPGSLDDIIQRAGSRYGVAPGLVRAVIKAESNFNSNAVSAAGAKGLMQLMPGTARSLGVTDSFDPEQNVMAGTRYLRRMLDRYDGDLDSALAAYNWGPGNVDRKGWSLPRETRSYLARVKELYKNFSG